MNRYRKKPIVIEAVQLKWETWNEVCDFIDLPWGDDGVHGVYLDENNNISEHKVDAKIGLIIPTLEGDMLAVEDDFIIKGVQGEYYPCKPDIFEQTYERI